MASIRKLKGLPVEITISDPWEFVTEHGSGPFAATVQAVAQEGSGPSRDLLLLRLATPIHHEGTICEYFVAGERSDRDRWADLLRGKSINCTFTRVPPEQARKGNPVDLTWWRGGVALLGSVRRAETSTPGASGKQNE
jgi:hypothetical protein